MTQCDKCTDHNLLDKRIDDVEEDVERHSRAIDGKKGILVTQAVQGVWLKGIAIMSGTILAGIVPIFWKLIIKGN